MYTKPYWEDRNIIEYDRLFYIYFQSESPSTSELNALGAYLLYSLVFVVAMMLEFAIIILLSRRKQPINNNSTGDMASGNQYENALALRLVKTETMPVGDAYQPETRNVGVDDNNGNRNQGMARMKKFISTMSIPQAIDFLAFWSFILIFVWFNFDQLLPLFD